MKKGALLLVALLSLPALFQSILAKASQRQDLRTQAEAPAPKRITIRDALAPLADLVASGESTNAGGYDAANNGYGMDLGSHGIRRVFGKSHHQITIGDIIHAQQSGQIHAAGRYQIIGRTMGKAVSWAGLTYSDAFSATNQDRLFLALIQRKRPAVWAYLTGYGSAAAAADAMAREWASISYWDGLGYYSGGRAHVSRPVILSALEQAREDMQAANNDPYFVASRTGA